MLSDLGLRAADVPIFVGEVEHKGEAPQSGGCESHNVQVNRIPEVIPTGHVISAEGLPGNGVDPWHFSAAGYRTLGKRYAEKVLDVMNHPEKYTKTYTIDERLTGTIADLSGKTFAIINESEQKAFYCPGGQELDYTDCNRALISIQEAYQFKLTRVGSGRGLKVVASDGSDYLVDGTIAYLNSQAADGNYCFVNGLNSQRGYDIPDGAVWEFEYVADKGWTLKNKGTGKFMKDASHPAMFDEPTYFTFCTLKEGSTTGIEAIHNTQSTMHNNQWYTLDGRRLDSKPTRSGLYIVNGKKVFIK